MFKVALSNFYDAKKSSNNEKKIKYYKILRILFARDLEFFAEIEKFIQFTGVVKSGENNNVASANVNIDAGKTSVFLKESSNKTSTQYMPSTSIKRKLDEQN